MKRKFGVGDIWNILSLLRKLRNDPVWPLAFGFVMAVIGFFKDRQSPVTRQALATAFWNLVVYVVSRFDPSVLGPIMYTAGKAGSREMNLKMQNWEPIEAKAQEATLVAVVEGFRGMDEDDPSRESAARTIALNKALVAYRASTAA